MKFRSKFEREVARHLDERGCPYEYEPETWAWMYTIPRAWCDQCQSRAVMKARAYTPDFYLPQQRLYIETKGRLDADDRTTLIGARNQHQDKRLYILFQRDNWMTKARRRRYTDWAEQNRFECAVFNPTKRIPDQWLISPK